MDFEDIRKKHGLGAKDEKDEDKDKATSTTTGGGLSYADIAKKHGVSYDVDDKYLDSFISDINAFSSADEATAYGTWNKLDLGSRSSTMRGWLNHNKSRLDEESYKSLSDTVDNYVKLGDFYSQFANEDEYSKHLKAVEEYEKKLNFNLEAGQRDIDHLENDLNGIKKTKQRIAELENENKILEQTKYKGNRNAAAQIEANNKTIATFKAAIEEAYAKYGSQEELEGYISQKRAYLVQSTRVQKAAELASVADVNSENYDPEFEKYSGYVSTTAESKFDEDIAYEYINGDEAKRSALEYKYNTYIKRYVDKGYGKLKESEKKIYNYYYSKYGKEKAQEYLDAIEETLIYRQGEGIYEDMLKDNTFAEYLFGIAAGLDQFSSGIDSLFSNEDYIPASATQVASGMVREDLADEGIPIWYNFKEGKWEDKILGNSTGQIFYDSITTTSNMLPSILTSTVVGLANPTAGAALGSTLLGASAAGNAKAEMLNLGYSKGQATAYGIMVGVAEGSMEYFLGHIPGLSKGDGIFSTLAGKAVSKVDNALSRVAIAIGGSLDEALEEGLQTIIEPWLKEIATNVDWDDPSIDEVLYSSLLGAISSIGLGGGNAAINAVLKNQQTINHGQAIIDKGGTDPLRELALEVAGVDQYAIEERTREQNKLAKLARKVEEKATAKNVGKLSTQLETTITEQNRTEIESALVEKGLTKREAKVAVKDIVGGELTTAEKSMIESDHFQAAIDAVLTDSDLNVSDGMAKLYEARLGKDATTPTDSPSVEGETPSVTENPTKKEIATEGKFEASAEGKTIVKETGKEVSIEEIVSNDGGNLMVKLDNGETVNAGDLEFATVGEALVYEMVADMGVNPKTAWGLVKAYDPSSGVKPQTFAIDMPLAYQYGKIGYVKGLERLNLTPEQRNTAYVLGRDDVKASGRTWSDTSRKTPETDKTKAADDGIFYEGFELNEDSLTEVQKASLAGVRTLAKMSPSVEFHMYESIVENGKKYAIVNGKKIHTPNGFFRNGNEIYIDINAGKGARGAFLYTASHEVVHFIAENSFEDFKALADFLFEHYGNNNVPVESLIKIEIDKLKKSYEAEGKALPSEPVLYMKAYEEVVANAMSKMFADPKSYEKLAKLKSENLTLWEKIGEAIKRMLDKLKSMLGIYEGRTPDQMAAHYVDDFTAEVYDKLQDLYIKGFVNAGSNYQASIGTRNLEDFADAKNTEGDTLLQYHAMEADEDTYREMLKKWGKMTDTQINNLFLTIDNAMELIKDNLEALDYAWEADIDDRAFSPVKPNSDKLYQVSLDFSTLCRKRILQQTIAAQLQEALNKPLSREEGIAIRDALIAIQEEGRQIEVACALCYVESARMKSPEQIKRFIENREAVIKEFFAGKSGGDIKTKIKKAEEDVREKLHKENPNGIKGKDGVTMLDPRTAKLNTLPKKYADEIREAKRAAKRSYAPTAEEQRIIEVAKDMTVSDFTSPEGLENLAKNYPSLFDAYTSYIRNATKSKGIENDTWWRAGDSMQIGDVLIANMNRENGLRSQSWSDFQVVHILDYIASTIELATRETKEQAYSKVPDYVELMGNTGVMINMSLIPTAKFNGTLDYDSVEGIDYKRALELRDKYHATAGTICIGVDNVQIKLLLEDITIDYVIPYHKSGMSAAIRKLMHIPTWSQYEEYQSEKNLSRADAEDQAKKYGVKLLDASDPNYHKGTSFSEWFDLKEAQQIAKMENANPSDKAKQKKYGVMYGGYMAMQNAANNYLKLCAERGISPKFSHEKADFTAEDNYWKLLIDRKMVDNITGDVIEQQTIKPIFDEREIMRILNDELERYPKVKEDQDYAIRKVTEAYLSGDLKGGMSAKDIAKVMQKPVDNVTNVNIFASAEGDTLFSVDDDFEEDSLDKYRENSYNLYNTTNDFGRQVSYRIPRDFTRSLANKTSGMTEGEIRTFYICGYIYEADGYMHGRILAPYNEKTKNLLHERKVEYGKIDENRSGASVWSQAVQYAERGSSGDIGVSRGRRSGADDRLLGTSSRSNASGNNERVRTSFETKEEADEIVKKLREMFGQDDKKHSDKATEDVLYSADDDTDSVSNRSLLANALESTVTNEIERKSLEEYKEELATADALEMELVEIRAKLRDLSFAKGPKNTEAIKKLREQERKTINRIDVRDKKLLRLEATKPLRDIIHREKAKAYKRAEQKGKEALAKYREKAAKTQRELITRYQESRKKGVESRRKTEMRHKIKDVVNELNQYLTKGTKEKHVPIELQKAVAEALDAVNMDTVGAEERIAKLQEELRTAKTLEDMKAITKKIERIQEMGGNLEAKLSRLKTAYDSIINSDDPLIANSHDDVISSSIDKVIEVVGDTPLRDMSLYQLEAVYDLYKMVLTSVRNANKAFKAAKGEEISTIANGVIAELDKQKKSPKVVKGLDKLSEFDWNNLKPVYAFERIGSANFTKVFNAVRAGEDVWATDMSEAKAFREEQFKKYKYDSWDFEKRYGFTSTSGMPFELSLDQILSLYAFSKRDQAGDHLKYGGFVFDGLAEIKEKKGKVVTVTYQLKDATAYNLSEETLAEIIDKLTPEQKAFADAMQDYLSTVMGEKGNEVSLALYDIKLFKEKHYFPLKSDTHYLAKAREQAQGDVKIKNSGFTKETKPKAKNPIVLSSFMDVWAGHVNEMSMYHAFTLPLEDFYRVYNYSTPVDEKMRAISVVSALGDAHRDAAVKYIDQLLKDINGGARSDSTVGFINKMIGAFKKSAVFASASVVIQQPSAIARATALVDTKYFVGKPSKGKHSDKWAEVKKYAPVAVIKEMGYFDTGMGKGSVEWLKGDKTFMDKVDDVVSKAPALADELAWVAIWDAVKRETVHNRKDLRPGSEEFLKAVGERFTEVVTKTQVYDSTLSRSANMRSKDTGMKMATAFMAEPTTSLNMLENALIQGKRGDKRYARKAIGSVVASMILNSILVSFVYAGRDDDEDKTYVEKYIGTLTEELLDSLNPLTLIPFVKDIVSIVQGYDVERSDMAVITDIINAWNNLDSDNRSVYRKVEDFAGAIAATFGLPVKNIMRDARAMYNTVNSFINGEKTTGAGIKNAIGEAVTGKEKSNGQQLYEAIVSGDAVQIERVKSGFKDQKAIDSAIRKALRENDSRIKEAAVARNNGDIAEYMRIAKQIIAEGHFKQDDIVAAINSEISALKKGEGTTESSSSNKATSIYKVDDYYAAIVGRDQATAYVVKEDLIKTDVANGKDRDEAEADFNSRFASHLRELYEEGDISDYEAQNMLVNYGGKSEEDASSKVQYWDFKKRYPDYDLSEEAVEKYYNEVEPSGIDIGVYYDYSKQRAKCKGTDSDGNGKADSGSVKKEVLYVIDSLPITYEQKDVLYYLNGWSASTIWEAPWH